MITLLTILQFFIVAIICIAVLLQKSSSIGLGAYSASNESLFGAKGPAGFLAKFTFMMGIILILNTIGLGYLYNSANRYSLAEKIQIETNTSIPSVPNLIDSSIPSVPKSPSTIPNVPQISNEINE